MRLTLYSDYSLRVLIYLALKGNSKCTISEISDSYGISKEHLRKVVHNLSKQGYLKTNTGRGGGLFLAKPASEIIVGEIVRKTEEDFKLVECFDPVTNTVTNNCVIETDCKLRHVLNEGLLSFLGVLDKYSIQDLVEQQKVVLKRSLKIKD